MKVLICRLAGLPLVSAMAGSLLITAGMRKKARMSGYDKLMLFVEKSTEEHPRSKVVIDAGSLTVVATGKEGEGLESKIREAKSGGRFVIVSQKSDDALSCNMHTFGL